jgi:hypothetical protein
MIRLLFFDYQNNRMILLIQIMVPDNVTHIYQNKIN